MNVITAKNLHFAYENETVVHDASFAIKKGDYVGLIGQNGSGKSTLVKLILGLLKAQMGSIELFDTSQKSFKDWHRIGYIPQRSGIFDQNFPAQVEEIVGMGLINTHTDKAAINRALEVVNLTTQKKRQLRELSGGQQQRVLIARALVSHPELLILDEPVVGVDQESQQSFYRLLKRLNKEHGITILLISHDLDIVAHEADYILTLNQGEICECAKEMIQHENKKYVTL